jgi:uncharacterized protein (DUF1499 family)
MLRGKCPVRQKAAVNILVTNDPFIANSVRLVTGGPHNGVPQESMERLITIAGNMNRATIVTATPSYLHVEFRSALFRFVDDVEFVLDDSARFNSLSAPPPEQVL